MSEFQAPAPQTVETPQQSVPPVQSPAATPDPVRQHSYPPPLDADRTTDTAEPAQTAQPQADDTEARARAMGWVSREEFRGPAENWRDAGEFVRRGEQELPIVRERLRDTSRKLNEMQSNFARLEKMNEVALRRQRDQIIGSYEAAMRDAVQSGDVARYDQLNNDRVTAVQNYDKQVVDSIREAQPQAQPAPPQIEEWVGRNPWFSQNREMQLVATARSAELERERPDLSIEQNLRETERYVRQRYADKFGGQQQQQPPRHPNGQFAPVESGSRYGSAGSSRSRGVADLPAEVRSQGERFVRQGIFKDLKEYATDYFAQEGV